MNALDALSRRDFLSHGAKTDFMANAFDRVGEPLNLLENGQAWFYSRYRLHIRAQSQQALVLGVTPWLGKLAAQTHTSVCMADQSQAMLAWARTKLEPMPPGCKLEQADWAALDFGLLDTVLGDNSFAFVPYRQGWELLRDRLYGACRPGARLFLRFFSVPTNYVPPTTAQLVTQTLRASRFDTTALRAAFMFSMWDSRTFGLNMAAAVDRFDAELPQFVPLVEKFGLPDDNDLITLRKYANSELTLYAPPVHEICMLFQRRFTIRELAYGPTPLSAHFPLLILEK